MNNHELVGSVAAERCRSSLAILASLTALQAHEGCVSDCPLRVNGGNALLKYFTKELLGVVGVIESLVRVFLVSLESVSATLAM